MRYIILVVSSALIHIAPIAIVVYLATLQTNQNMQMYVSYVALALSVYAMFKAHKCINSH